MPMRVFKSFWDRVCCSIPALRRIYYIWAKSWRKSKQTHLFD